MPACRRSFAVASGKPAVERPAVASTSWIASLWKDKKSQTDKATAPAGAGAKTLPAASKLASPKGMTGVRQQQQTVKMMPAVSPGIIAEPFKCARNLPLQEQQQL